MEKTRYDVVPKGDEWVVETDGKTTLRCLRKIRRSRQPRGGRRKTHQPRSWCTVRTEVSRRSGLSEKIIDGLMT